jgi:hypothetical protein
MRLQPKDEEDENAEQMPSDIYIEDNNQAVAQGHNLNPPVRSGSMP